MEPTSHMLQQDSVHKILGRGASWGLQSLLGKITGQERTQGTIVLPRMAVLKTSPFHSASSFPQDSSLKKHFTEFAKLQKPYKLVLTQRCVLIIKGKSNQ